MNVKWMACFGICGWWLLAAGSALAQQNDHFANATDLSGLALPYTGFHSVAGTAEQGEPAHAGSPAVNSVWFQWKTPVGGACAFGEYLNGAAARIAIYTGDDVAGLTLVAAGTTRVFFQAQAGVRYRIALDSPGADVAYLRTYPAGGADEMAAADVISGGLPLRVHGNNVLATAAPTDEDIHPEYDPTSTVWWRWTAPSSGAVRVDARNCDFGPMMAIYEQAPAGAPVRVTGGFEAAGWVVTAGNDYFIRFDETVYGPGEVNFWFEWMPTTPPPNDNIAAATDLGSAAVACDGSWIFFATPEPGLPQEDLGLPQFGIPGDRTIWWKWTCPRTGYYRFSLRGSDIPPEVLVYTGMPAALSIITGLENVDGVRIQANAGTLYWVKLRDGRRRCARSELNIYPAETETAYFERLDQRGVFRLHGAQRHPEADPDGDSFSNQIELACYGNPELGDTANPNLPHLVQSSPGIWRLRWLVDSSYLSHFAGPSLVVKGQTSGDLSGVWQTPTQIYESGDVYSVALHAGGRGFARLRVEDPNLALPVP